MQTIILTNRFLELENLLDESVQVAKNAVTNAKPVVGHFKVRSILHELEMSVMQSRMIALTHVRIGEEDIALNVIALRMDRVLDLARRYNNMRATAFKKDVQPEPVQTKS